MTTKINRACPHNDLSDSLRHRLKLIVYLLLVSVVTVNVRAETYYVTPAATNSSCPQSGVSCLTLNEYAVFFNDFRPNDIDLIFLPGNHNLDTNFTITNVTSLSINVSTSISNTSSRFEVNVFCNVSVRFLFAYIDQVEISGLSLSGCHGSIAYVEDQLVLSNFELFGSNFGPGLKLSSVHFASIYNSIFSANGKFSYRTGDENQLSEGGAVSIYASNVSITDTTIDSNFASFGGSVYAMNSPVVVKRSNFTINIATYRGGALETEQCNVTIEGCTFTDNRIVGLGLGNDLLSKDTVGGGAVSLSTSTAVISNSKFIVNSVTYQYGGAVFASSTRNVTVKVDNCTFYRNTAFIGGAFAITSHITAEVTDSVFTKNTGTYGGGAIGTFHSPSLRHSTDDNTIEISMTVKNCHFAENIASISSGGAIVSTSPSTIEITDSTLDRNTGSYAGGAVAILSPSNVNILGCTFTNNSIDDPSGGGGAVGVTNNSNFTIDGGVFIGNRAPSSAGGAIAAVLNYLFMVIRNSVFISNKGNIGGAVVSYYSPTVLQNCSFTNNQGQSGVGFYVSNCENECGVTIEDCSFFQNQAAITGAGVLFIGASNVNISGTLELRNNSGSVFIYNSVVLFAGVTVISNNEHTHESGVMEDIEQAGGITCFESITYFTGETYITNNTAEHGGGVQSIESVMYFNGNTTIMYNKARHSGGGVLAYQSVLYCNGSTNIASNIAGIKGGGIYSVSTGIKLMEGQLLITSNNALPGNGGGIYMESNSKLGIIKDRAQCAQSLPLSLLCLEESVWPLLHFANNTANYGGAIFIADETNSGICTATEVQSSNDECFFQTLISYNVDVYQIYDPTFSQLVLNNTRFTNNVALAFGDSLFGGLLDRCSVSPFAEFLLWQRYQQQNSTTFIGDDAVTYLSETTNLQKDDVYSFPVRVCFCTEAGEPDCTYQPLAVLVSKGESFRLPVVAVDQLDHIIPNTTIQGSVPIPAFLNEGQNLQRTNDGCTEVKYNVFTPNSLEQLSLFAHGPCRDRGISTTSVAIKLADCPIGFKEMTNRCECDKELYPKYVTNCSIDSKSVLRKDNVWISYVNTTENKGYVKFLGCPLDYCIAPTEPDVSVNLNILNGADAQCANNRSGILCGACADSLSLTLGGSRCKDCSSDNAYLSLLIVFAIAGLLLVALLLICNLTVAVGTINGLIFYANVIAPAHSIFFRPLRSPFVIIAWINLDFGIETCFFNGMDTYAKTWLQLAFPLYIEILVALVIIIANYSQRFSKVLSNRNPVATLATLILLSYTKLLRVIITVFSFATLEYPDGSVRAVWLADANIAYFEGKHIPLFIAAVIILVVVLVYTLLIFSWQWLVRLSDKRLFKWVANTKLNSFMDAYHAPYKPQHRYWTGLLLLARVLLYIVLVSNSKAILFAIIFIGGVLLLLNTPTSSGLYKSWPLNFLESTFIFNLVVFAAATSYIQENEGNQAPLANASAGIAMFTFGCILIYHTYVLFTSSSSTLERFVAEVKNKVTLFLKTKFTKSQKEQFPDSLSTSLLPSSTHKNSFRLQQRLDLIADEPIVPGPADLLSVESVKPQAVTHSVVDAIPSYEEKSIDNVV